MLAESDIEQGKAHNVGQGQRLAEAKGGSGPAKRSENVSKADEGIQKQ